MITLKICAPGPLKSWSTKDIGDIEVLLIDIDQTYFTDSRLKTNANSITTAVTCATEMNKVIRLSF